VQHSNLPSKPQCHFAPLFGVVAGILDLSAYDTLYVFLLNHVKAVMSAAVRAGVIGPYQSHSTLSSLEIKGWIEDCISRCSKYTDLQNDVENDIDVDIDNNINADQIGVTIPIMDIWMGRHELLYSRIFNS